MFFELRIQKMVQGGAGLSRLPDGRVCFVRGVLPLELCKIKITKDAKDVAFGSVVEILESSPDRIKPLCKCYNKCGGCSLQHIKPEREIFYLEQIERENFRRMAHADLPPNFKIHEGAFFGYRNRARIVLRKVKGQVIYGFRGEKSNDVVPFESCPVLTAALNNFLKDNASKIFESANSGVKKCQELDLNIFDNENGKVSFFYHGMSAKEFEKNATSVVDILGVKIKSDASVFFQSNLKLLPELAVAVKSAAAECVKHCKTSWLIDLFSGVGFFAALLQNDFKKITTVERDIKCLVHAKTNLQNMGANVQNVAEPAEIWLRQNVVNEPATLIVDPPRTGVPAIALDAIIKSSVKAMIYVSCDPVTLARDFVKLNAAGFNMVRAEGFAFYPHTPHLEMLLVLFR